MSTRAPDLTDRLTIRARPGSPPIGHQSWDKVLFLHWRVPVEWLRPFVPHPLEIDTHHGSAWIGVTPFTVSGARPASGPRLPWVGDFHEVNVRTYVHVDRVPGVWFFSLDANSMPAVLGARALFHLPYHHATIRLDQDGGPVSFQSERDEATRPARFDAAWSIGQPLAHAEPGSLEFFHVERYALYSANDGTLYRARIHHQPWPLQACRLIRCATTLIEAGGLRTPTGDPRLLCGGPVDVEAWPLEEVARIVPARATAGRAKTTMVRVRTTPVGTRRSTTTAAKRRAPASRAKPARGATAKPARPAPSPSRRSAPAKRPTVPKRGKVGGGTRIRTGE